MLRVHVGKRRRQTSARVRGRGAAEGPPGKGERGWVRTLCELCGVRHALRELLLQVHRRLRARARPARRTQQRGRCRGCASRSPPHREKKKKKKTLRPKAPRPPLPILFPHSPPEATAALGNVGTVGPSPAPGPLPHKPLTKTSPPREVFVRGFVLFP